MWLLFLLPIVAAADPKTVFVGQLFSISLPDGAQITTLPKWLVRSESKVSGIPAIENVGMHVLQYKFDGQTKSEKIVVSDDDTNPCGISETTWLEALFNDELDLKQQIDAIAYIAKKINTSVEQLRLFGFTFSREIRQVKDLMEEVNEGKLTIVRPYCGGEEDQSDALDQASDDMDKLLEDDESEFEFDVTITKGKMLPLYERLGSQKVKSTSMKTTTMRSTRHAGDRPPVRLNNMKSFECVRGVFCEALVPETMFKDAEDGDTYKLSLSVVKIEGKSNWLYYKNKKVEGVPLQEGEYRFRLEARDRKGQMAPAAFSVKVSKGPVPNHKLTFELDIRSNLNSNPELLSDFVHQLAEVTSSKPEDISIRSIQRSKDRTVVVWSNASLPTRDCDEAAFDPMLNFMLTRSSRRVMSRRFEKAMTERFNLRKIEFEKEGNCLKSTEVVTTVPTMEAAADGGFPYILLIVALVAFLLLAALILFCCTRKTKKTKQSEFLGKGQPVVFPEELQDEQELVHAATPMLTKEERPPFKVSQHENPLYKPPPPLSTSSPRVGAATTLSTQKMPPPYAPP